MNRVINKASHAPVAETVARLIAEVEAGLAARYQLSADLAAGLAGIDARTDAAVGR